MKVQPGFNEFYNPDNWFKAWHKIQSVSGWKSSVQSFGAGFMKNLIQLISDLETGRYQPGAHRIFPISERGHIRLIRALNVRDILLQHVLCDAILIPTVRPHLIYDNGASLKGRGTGFARARLETHLRRYFRQYGDQGWALRIDFRKFFDNIPHAGLLQALQNVIHDPAVIDLVRRILLGERTDITGAGVDPDAVFDSFAFWKQHGELRGGAEFLNKGLSIGSSLSQLCGIFYPTPCDNWARTVCRSHFYARYMDDAYVLDPDRERLEYILQGYRDTAARLGLTLHPKKTCITPISAGISFLKIRYSFTETGRVLKVPDPAIFTRERRRLKKLAAFVAQGEISADEYNLLWRSWCGSFRAFDCRRALNDLQHDKERFLKDALSRKL